MKEHLAQVARAAATLFGKFLLVFVPLTLFNWIFAAWMYPSIYDACFGKLDLSENAALGAFVGIEAIFALLFPFLYFNIGRNYAIQSVLYGLFQKNKIYIFQYLVEKIFDYTSKKHMSKEQMTAWLSKGNDYLEKMDNLNFALRWIFRYLLGKIPFTESFERVCAKTAEKDFNAEQLGSEVAAMISDEVLNDAFKPSLLIFTLVFLGNLSLGAALVYWLMNL